MASTNKTTNYELSQFLGSDKPAWLADYNADMSKIDTQMKANNDLAVSAGGNASAVATSLGSIANLETTDKTSAVSAINEVNTKVTTAQNTANSASTSANNANTNIAKFNLTNKSVLTTTSNKGTIDSANTLVQFATDNTSSIFKIYGRINLDNLTNLTGNLTITLGQTSLRPSTAYTINSGAIVYRYWSDGASDTIPRNLNVGTDGVVTITDTLESGSTSVKFMCVTIPPCLYFNSDFGDQ